MFLRYNRCDCDMLSPSCGGGDQGPRTLEHFMCDKGFSVELKQQSPPPTAS